MNFDIIEVFTRAGKITWKYKILWIFGMFASCGRSSGSSNSNSSSDQSNGNPFSPEMTRQLENFFESIGTWFNQNTWVIFAFVAFVLILIAVQIFLTNVGTAGLARGVVHAENGVETLHFGELFSESLKYFWRLFGSALIIFLPVFVFLLLFIVIVAVSLGGSSANAEMIGGSIFLLVIALCCCLVPVSLFLNLYNIQVVRAITVEEMGVFTALSRGWQVLIKNILGVILVAIVMGIGSAIINILISLPAILILVPLMFSLVNGNITSWQPFIISGIFLLCYSPIAWFFSGVLITYTDSVWTLIYLRVTKPKEENTPILAEGNA